MSNTEKPVLVWLPAQAQPVRCGTFSLVSGVAARGNSVRRTEEPVLLSLSDSMQW